MGGGEGREKGRRKRRGEERARARKEGGREGRQRGTKREGKGGRGGGGRKATRRARAPRPRAIRHQLDEVGNIRTLPPPLPRLMPASARWAGTSWTKREPPGAALALARSSARPVLGPPSTAMAAAVAGRHTITTSSESRTVTLGRVDCRMGKRYYIYIYNDIIYIYIYQYIYKRKYHHHHHKKIC